MKEKKNSISRLNDTLIRYRELINKEEEKHKQNRRELAGICYLSLSLIAIIATFHILFCIGLNVIQFLGLLIGLSFEFIIFGLAFNMLNSKENNK